MLDFADLKDEGRSIFFPLHLDLETAEVHQSILTRTVFSAANRRQTTENIWPATWLGRDEAISSYYNVLKTTFFLKHADFTTVCISPGQLLKCKD